MHNSASKISRRHFASFTCLLLALHRLPRHASMLPGHAYAPIDKAEGRGRAALLSRACVALTGLALLLLSAYSVYSALLRPAGSAPVAPVRNGSDSAFDSAGRFVMHAFDRNRPMSNFLPGLGGLFGVPMWAFYVNRGQGVAGFGVQNKDGAIMKFNSAEKAYQNTALTGFRTFVKGRVPATGKAFSSAPFDRGAAFGEAGPARSMMIGVSEMEIEETDSDNGLQTNVLYFTVSNEDFPGLVRQTTFTNLGAHPLELEFLDGLARLVPAGLGNAVLDAIGRTMEAWMNVYNTGRDTTLPFFHISQSTADTAIVQEIKEGHFVLAFVEGAQTPLPFVVDPATAFDFDTELESPVRFWSAGLDALLGEKQATTSRTPCALAGGRLSLAPGARATVTSVYGHADSLELFLADIKDRLLVSGFAATKRAEAKAVVESVTSQVAMTSGSSLFDRYAEQSYLDNVLRGGLPLALGLRTEPKTYHVYSRIHGDLERDYNNFQIEASFFSQGPGSFRDVNQNRRVDVLINPFVEDFNIRLFLSFIQADGFNPLTVAGTNFKVPASRVPLLINEMLIDNVPAMTKLLAKPFRIGSLLKDMKTNGITSFLTREDLVHRIAVASEQHFAAMFNQNGFWADHWTYTLDQFDSYGAVYPDREEAMLYGEASVPFFMSPALVRARADRYLAVNITANTTAVRVYNAISVPSDPDYPKTRKAVMDKLMLGSDYVADAFGASNMWQRVADLSKPLYVTPIAKLAILGFLKFSSLDQSGFGVEMEGGKPGWNDAMNGLPGIVGSGMPETYEMLRIIVFVKRVTEKYGNPISFPTEFATFLDSISDALQLYKASSGDAKDVAFWDECNNARELYRGAVNTTFTGEMTEMSASDVLALTTLMEEKVRSGIARAIAVTPGAVTPSYFYHEVTAFTTATWSFNKDVKVATPLAFKRRALPIFLEGPTRQLKTVDDIAQRRAIYTAVRSSGLYDKALKMFYLSESLESMGQEVGRMKAFSPGWLENQSIWLHMSYKFYLELLRGGLYEEFFAEVATGLVPFMPFDVYGRSPTESSSFIVSSAFPDARIHGEGFLPRLSGSTAEMLSMWLIMMVGDRPFVLENGVLCLRLRPVIPAWMFAEDDTVKFTFLGSVTVTYHNPQRLDTWRAHPKAAALVTALDERVVVPDPASITGDLAAKVRGLSVKSIDVFY